MKKINWAFVGWLAGNLFGWAFIGLSWTRLLDVGRVIETGIFGVVIACCVIGIIFDLPFGLYLEKETGQSREKHE